MSSNFTKTKPEFPTNAHQTATPADRRDFTHLRVAKLRLDYGFDTSRAALVASLAFGEGRK